MKLANEKVQIELKNGTVVYGTIAGAVESFVKALRLLAGCAHLPRHAGGAWGWPAALLSRLSWQPCLLLRR